MVKQFYRDVARLPQISDQEMGTAMQQLSVQQNDEFDTIAALKELYIYVTKYRAQVNNFGQNFAFGSKEFFFFSLYRFWTLSIWI